MLDSVMAYNLFENLPDLESVTFLVRTPTATPGGTDSFAAYPLYYAKRRAANRGDFAGGGEVLLAEDWLVFMLFQYDLDQFISQGAQPYRSYEILDQTGGFQTGNLAGTNVVSGLASTVGLVPGMGIIGQGIPAGTTLTAVAANSVTLSQSATLTANNVNLTFGVQWAVASLVRHPTGSRWDATCRRLR